MKKYFVFIVMVLLCITTIFAQTDYRMMIEKTDGSYAIFKNDEIRQVFFLRGSLIPQCYIYADCSLVEITKEQYYNGMITLLSDVKDLGESVIIKGRGNSSWRMPKKCYNIKFEEKTSLLGMPKDKKWVAVANYADKSLVRNLFVSILGKDVFDNLLWTPSFSTVDMFFNGDYMGAYILGETIKIGKSRVNIQNLEDVESYLEGHIENVSDINGDGEVNIQDGGFILEINYHMDEAFNFITTQGVRISLKDPHEVSNMSQENIKKIVQTAEDVLYSESFTDNIDGWQKYFDQKSMIDWYLIQEFTKSVDSDFFTSVYMYYNPKTRKLHMGPIWDFDLACGNVVGETSSPEGWYVNQVHQTHCPANYYNRLFEDPLFRNNLIIRWNEIKASLYDLINNRIILLAEDIKPAAGRNFEKWQILGIQSWKDAEGYADRKTYEDEVQYLITWLNKRFEWFDNAINNLNK